MWCYFCLCLPVICQPLLLIYIYREEVRGVFAYAVWSSLPADCSRRRTWGYFYLVLLVLGQTKLSAVFVVARVRSCGQRVPSALFVANLFLRGLFIFIVLFVPNFTSFPFTLLMKFISLLIESLFTETVHPLMLTDPFEHSQQDL